MMILAAAGARARTAAAMMDGRNCRAHCMWFTLRQPLHAHASQPSSRTAPAHSSQPSPPCYRMGARVYKGQTELELDLGVPTMYLAQSSPAGDTSSSPLARRDGKVKNLETETSRADGVSSEIKASEPVFAPSGSEPTRYRRKNFFCDPPQILLHMVVS